MADSEDEYDRKRRDKFRGERSSGDSFRAERRDDRRVVGGGGIGGGRDDWSDRNPFRGGGGGGAGGGGGRPRPDYRDYRGPRDRYGSPGREMAPAKRMRPDWGDEMRGGPRYGGYDPYLMHAWNEHYAAHSMHGGYGGGGGHGHMPHPRESMGGGGLGPGSGVGGSDTQTQPAMLTLKQFLDTQDDGISDSEVMRKYGDYKLEFKRQQLNEFFVAHKDEEWFKMKYHPQESVKRKDEQLGFLQKRVDVFNELLDNGQIKAVTIDTSQTDPLLRLLDTVVIKLEGGTEDDLKILDEKTRDITYSFEKKLNHRDDDVIITSVEKKPDEPPKAAVVATALSAVTDEEPLVVSPRPERTALVSDDEENWDIDDDDDAVDAVKKSTTADGPATSTEELAAPKSPDEPVVEEEHETKKDKKKAMKHKRTNSDSSSSTSSDSDTSSSSSSDDDDNEKIKSKYDVHTIKSEMDAEAEEAKVNVKQDYERDEGAAVVAEGATKDDMKKALVIDGDESAEQPSENGVTAEITDGGDPKNSAESKENEDNDEKIQALSPTVDAIRNSDEDVENQKSEEDDVEKAAATVDDATAKDNADKATVIKDKDAKSVANDQPETIDLDKEKDVPQPRALHRTSSIFLRNLAPSITKAEIETICQRFDGYLRVAIADPLVERRWYRRGWVTFTRDVNIKEICWNLNNTRLRDCEMGAIVNRDLSRRVRPVNGMTAHKTIVRSDIKLCAKIAMNLDEKFKLWDKSVRAAADNNAASLKDERDSGNGSTSEAMTSASYGFKSNNPVLQNITDFLIEEASAEEEELLGISGEHKEADGESIDRDAQLISVLDSLILYLRIVHSVDFYNHCEYPYEDEMPNRCGIIHARGPLPQKVSANDMQDYIKNFDNKMQTFLAKTTTIESDELKQLGSKDAEAEVEKFVQANTQELAKDKWLCPLSGKKFKGPEFIRKHIFNKHGEKVEEVRKEVEFFNNYLRDPKRPQLPEHPGSNKRSNSESSGGGGGGGYRAQMYPPSFAPPYASYAPPMMMSGRGGGRGFGGGGGGRREMPSDHQRRIIGYHDLDAPANFDMFD